MWNVVRSILFLLFAACGAKPAPRPPADTPPSPTPPATPTASPSKVAPLFADLFVEGKRYVYRATTTKTDSAGNTKTDSAGEMDCKAADLVAYATGSVIALDCEIRIDTITWPVKFFFIATANGLWISGDSSDQSWFDELVTTPAVLLADPVPREQSIDGERYITTKRADGAWCGSRSEEQGLILRTVCFAPGIGPVTIGSLTKFSDRTVEQMAELKR